MACWLLATYSLFAQGIEINTWRTHLNYHNAIQVTSDGHRIFAATPEAILLFDPADNSLRSIDKVNGLTTTGITSIAYDALRNQLLIGYRNGLIDILQSKKIRSVKSLVESVGPSSKRINHIYINGDYAYLSADFGVTILNLQQLEVTETFRDLGIDGSEIKVYQSVVVGDSIFLATQHGLLGGDLNNNLLDFNNWKRYNSDELNGPVSHVAHFNGQLYAFVDHTGMLQRINGNFVLLPELQGEVFRIPFESTINLLIPVEGALWEFSSSGVLSEITNPLISDPVHAIRSAQTTWIADRQNGLVSDHSGTFEPFQPNGSGLTIVSRLAYSDNAIRAIGVPFTPSGDGVPGSDGYSVFENSKWTRQHAPFDFVTATASVNGNVYVSSFGDGLARISNAQTNVFNEINSPLQQQEPGEHKVRVTGLYPHEGSIWLTNYGVSKPLHVVTGSGTWSSFSFPDISAASYPLNLIVDSRGFVWMIIDPAFGGGLVVFNPATQQSRYLTNQPGSGGLPNRNVYVLEEDRNGLIWVGTGSGVAFFSNPTNIFSVTTVNAVRPVFEGRFLLNGERISALETDGGNRKWIGTQEGLFLFNAMGDEQVHHFTAENSPLLSDEILALKMDPASGELFIATSEGLISFRTDSSEGIPEMNEIKIFPNPVTAFFSGTVGISQLTADARLNITDVSGRRIKAIQAVGGTATWDVRDFSGKRVAAGVYLVFAISQDGSESIVGKIIVID